jgi:DNA-binding transcriptional LysR family regulator
MVAMNDAILLAALRDGELDLVVGPMVDGDEDIDSEQFAEDEVVVMTARTTPFSTGPYTLADLLAYKWLLPARRWRRRQFLDQTFERQACRGRQCRSNRMC